jgi:type III pantothenate kinase
MWNGGISSVVWYGIPFSSSALRTVTHGCDPLTTVILTLIHLVSRSVLLVVDVGNTQTHFGTYERDRLVEHWRFATVRESTADELGATLRSLLELRGVGLAALTSSIVSSTVPELGPEWARMADRYLGHEMVLVGPGIRTGMALRYDNPREIGADRLVNAVAAYERVGGACVCVDFGTAITFDPVSEEGEYLGGVISPGVEISMDALTERAAKLPKIDLSPPRSVIGKNTADAIRSGIIYGFAGQVDAIVRRLRGELGEGAKTIATGGLARHIVPYTETIDVVDDLLTLEGLRILHSRNYSS